MLKLKDITKSYTEGESSVLALKGVNISFRKSEFVSILGQSGGGKSTLLNIIGGLDHYTDGDLIINGRSTKDFDDRDWDSYRNHSVGFVFQSYNLIPHQTVLSNVELALTLQGIEKEERKRKAVEALKEVGLEDQIYKNPMQLSGGQMQRVAIARALVNNPDILLADEPTGALDSETSLQVMNILKKVAKDRLVIMVTHNSELAEKYSTRIISLRDGKIINDTNPFDGKEVLEGREKYKKLSMGFKSAFLLSLDNLMTKKGRTILTAFAGSIGIIGIALILALSTGVNNYIKDIQEDTMTSYPIVLNKESINISAFTNPSSGNNDNENDGIYSNNMILKKKTELSSSIAKNNLSAFKEYLENGNSKINKYLGKNGINYTYDTNYSIFTYDKNGEIVNTDGTTLEGQYADAGSLSSQESSIMNFINAQMSAAEDKNLFSEILKGSGDKNISDSIYNSYDLVYGSWPEKYDEVVLVLNSNNEIQSTALYQLGLLPSDEYREIIKRSKEGEEIDLKSEKLEYKDMCSQNFYVVPPCNYFVENNNGIFSFDGTDSESLDKLIKGGIELKISGIIRAKDSDNALISGNVGYTHDLTEYIINYTDNSNVVKKQKENPDINVLNGIRFDQADNNIFSYDENLKNFGVVDLNSPSSISIYVDSFEDKNQINNFISEYNDSVSQDKKIVYTDYVALLMSSVTRIINTITVVLVAFVSVSLVVSSIMIGIITYISVLERKKEIGILRAIGASKKDVSRVFVAETFIIGLFAGLIGVIITYLVRIPINALIYSLTSIDNVNVTLPLWNALILVIISVLLTLGSGLIPAKIAAKKDPAQALRSE